jgi:pimeloyl-ACP methyl ester carboxylesterase
VAKLLPSNARPAPYRAARDAGDDYGATASPDWRETDWRRHLRQVDIEGSRVNYVDIGEGEREPVVFVHGLGGCWQNWLENIPRFAQERRVVALDLPGFGYSEMPDGEISVSRYGRCVNAVCDRLGLEKIALVGNSMGGFVSAETAIAFPERVERLVLAAAAGISITNLSRQTAMTWARTVSAVATYGAARHRVVAARPRLRHVALALVARHPSLLKPDLVYEGLMRGVGKEGFMPAMHALLEYDFTDRLPEIRCPTLVVWGEEDLIIGVDDADEFERLIPNSRKLIMKDTGHIPMVERPQVFNDCLAEFLAEERGVGEDQAAERAA